jgi:hypothetical protein
MEEKGKITKNEVLTKKLDWEPPKLISLDKGKTEGGSFTGEPEGTSYVGTQS